MKMFVAGSIGAVLSLIGCGSEKDELLLSFADELIEAPVREADIQVLKGVSCETRLAVLHDLPPVEGMVVAQQTARWPVNPRVELFDRIPRNTPLTFDVATYNAEHVQTARACATATLAKDRSERVALEMRTLPSCAAPPTSLDLLILIDTSLMAASVDTDLLHLSELYPRVIEAPALPDDTRFTLVTQGGTGVTELLPATSDRGQLRDAITALRQMHEGPSHLFDGIERAASMLRARAVCGRRPVLFIISGSEDRGSQHLAEDAALGVIGVRADPTDDLYTYALALSNSAYEELERLIPEEAGHVTGASWELTRRTELTMAGRAIRALIP